MKILEELVQRVSKLPGLGPRSARRLVLYLLKRPEKYLDPLITSLKYARQIMGPCSLCFNISDSNPCHICQDVTRIRNQLCVVAGVEDVWAIERANVFQGKYHVLGGLLSAVDGMGPDQLTLNQLIDRISKENIEELVFALSPTIDGQTTMHYILSQIKHLHVRCSSLACGVPLGGELDYLDDGTLTLAFKARQNLSDFAA